MFAYLIIGFIEPVCDLYPSKSKMAGTLHGTFIFDILERVQEGVENFQNYFNLANFLISRLDAEVLLIY